MDPKAIEEVMFKFENYFEAVVGTYISTFQHDRDLAMYWSKQVERRRPDLASTIASLFTEQSPAPASPPPPPE